MQQIQALVSYHIPTYQKWIIYLTLDLRPNVIDFCHKNLRLQKCIFTINYSKAVPNINSKRKYL